MSPQDQTPFRAIVLSLKPDASRIWLNADGDFRHELNDPPIGTSKPARQRRGSASSFERFPDGTLVWSKNGICHRHGGPAVIWSNGDREWWRDGLHHRSNGPAIEAADGSLQVWYRNGLHHREEGPAILYPDGSEEWFHHGLRHRDQRRLPGVVDGPAVNYPGELMQWYSHGVLHREDGPAVLWSDGRQEWFLNGRPHMELGPTSERPGRRMPDDGLLIPAPAGGPNEPPIGAVMPDDPRRGMRGEGTIEPRMRAVDAREQSSAGERRIGGHMPDGTIYAGLSPSNGKPLYTTPADAPLVGALQAAQSYASHLDAHGHADWRLPTKAELNLLFRNCAAIGAFNITGSLPDGWYWSSTHADDSFAWGRRFSDGFEMSFAVFSSLSVRLVR